MKIKENIMMMMIGNVFFWKCHKNKINVVVLHFLLTIHVDLSLIAQFIKPTLKNKINLNSETIMTLNHTTLTYLMSKAFGTLHHFPSRQGT